MRDLTATGRLIMPPCAPTGVAFTIGDLSLVKNWAAYHDYHMTIRLDHGSDHEEYEEVLEFRQGWNAAFKIILWRNERTVFIQPLLGRRRQFQSVAAALDSLQAEERVFGDRHTGGGLAGRHNESQPTLMELRRQRNVPG